MVENLITLTVGAYPPYIDESAPNKGFLTEIVSSVGVESQLDFKPWKRIEQTTIDNPRGYSCSWVYGDVFPIDPYVATQFIRKNLLPRHLVCIRKYWARR